MNNASVYTHKGLIHPAPGVWTSIDKPLFDATTVAGIWVGRQDINAETQWYRALGDVQIRVSSYKRQDLDVVVPSQIPKGWGPSFTSFTRSVTRWSAQDNEYGQRPVRLAQYFVGLINEHRDVGFVVPLTYDDPGPCGNFIDGTAAVDFYGFGFLFNSVQSLHCLQNRPIAATTPLF